VALNFLLFAILNPRGPSSILCYWCFTKVWLKWVDMYYKMATS